MVGYRVRTTDSKVRKITCLEGAVYGKRKSLFDFLNRPGKMAYLEMVGTYG
ncbi:MAG: hypothetical protein K5989_00295 [Lachnospiraceae bacterium]|nr:hypothetical protein [Lachnospiraceae bacterium]